MHYTEWIKLGIDNGWCTSTVCYTHDGVPMTEDEEQQFEQGDDPCIHISRMCETPEQQQQIEQTHSASAWRRTNLYHQGDNK